MSDSTNIRRLSGRQHTDTGYVSVPAGVMEDLGGEGDVVWIQDDGEDGVRLVSLDDVYTTIEG